MSEIYKLTMTVKVFDEPSLIRVATAHARRTTNNIHTTIDDAHDGLIMLLDPGGGGAAYSGNLNHAGIEIEETTVDHLSSEDSPIFLSEGPTGPATMIFHPQAWVNDNAIDTDPEGETNWSVADLPLDIASNTPASDGLKMRPEAPEWVRNWSGPYWVEIKRSPKMTFEEFQATKTHCDDLGAALSDAHWEDCPTKGRGFLYLGRYYIEEVQDWWPDQAKAQGNYHLLLFNYSEMSDDLTALERLLYDFAMNED